MQYKQQELVLPDRDRGYVCPHCNSYCKAYRRKLNSNMAIALLTLYKKKVIGFVHLENFMTENGYKRCGDASYLVHWGFLEKLVVKREDNSRRNGYYKLTGRGIMFCEGKITAKQKIVIYNNTLEGFEGEDITIQTALGTKFSFTELMQNQ